MLAVITQLIIEIAIITWGSLKISDGSFWWHAGICLGLIVICIILAIVRSEDSVEPGSGKRRHFMTLAHATVWSFFIGIFLI